MKKLSSSSQEMQGIIRPQPRIRRERDLASVVYNPKIEKKKKREEREFGLTDALQISGLVYSLFLGTTTLGAIGGLVYSLISGDVNTGRDVALGATAGAALEPFVLIGSIIYGLSDCNY